jgi:hypothetical protein
VYIEKLLRSAAVFGGICHPFRRALSSVVSLYSAAGVNPEVPQFVTGGLLATEYNLAVASFTLGMSTSQIDEGDLFSSAGVRKYSVGWELVRGEVGQGKVATIAKR